MLLHCMSQVATIAIIISPYYQIISAEMNIMFVCCVFFFDNIQIKLFVLFCFVYWHSISLFIVHDIIINL